MLQLLRVRRGSLDLLASGVRDAQRHQQTLRDTILWSVRLLTPSARRLFAQLSVFAGGFTHTAAAAVAGAPADEAAVALALDELVSHHLLQVMVRESDEIRFRMLWAIREVADELLRETTEAEAVQRRHAQYYLALSEAHGGDIRSALRTAALILLDAKRDDLRTALQWLTEHDAAGATRMAAALAWYFRDARIWDVGVQLIDRVLALDIERTPEVTANLIAVVCWIDIDFDPAGAEARIKRRIATLRSDVERYALGRAFEALGRLLRRCADFAGAERWLRAARAMLRTAGDPIGEGIAVQGLGIVARDRGDGAAALRLYRTALRRAHALGHPLLAAMAQLGLGDLRADAGDWAGAIAAYTAAGEYWPNVRAWAAQHLATAHMRIGDYAAAEAYALQALAGSRAEAQSFGISWSCIRLGELMRRTGRIDAARAYLAEGLELAVATRANATPAALAEIAAICALQGDAPAGARLLGAESALRAQLGFPVWPCDRAAYEEIVEQLRSMLGARRFVQIRRADAVRPFAQVVEQARAAVGSATVRGE